VAAKPTAAQPTAAAAQPTAAAAQPTAAAAQPTAAAAKPAAVTYADWGYSGDLQKVFRDNLGTPFEKSHAGVTVKMAGGKTDDVIPQIKAAQGASPYDSIMLGETRFIQAKREGWITPLTPADTPNLKDVNPDLQKHCEGFGVVWTYSVMGLEYNEKLVPKPESWMDLWKPEYKGKIGLASPAANLGHTFVNLLARLNGGDEGHYDLAFQKLHDLGTFVAVPSPEALGDLLSRGELGVGIQWSDNAAVDMQTNPDLKFVLPKPGAVALPSCYGIVKGSANIPLAKEWLNNSISKEFQTAFSRSPWYFQPTNMQVSPAPDAIEKSLAPGPEDTKNLVILDMVTATANRPAQTDRFNKEFGQ
jgi:putative spermidine/putrescine transport system substrate-binding protein